VMDERGRSGPEPGKLADVLMAWLIGQEVAHRLPIKPAKPRGSSTRPARIRRSGWN
jgi:hypothetical protein